MTLDTERKIATGRSWRDLPDVPPVADTVDAVTATAPTADLGGATDPATSETTLEGAAAPVAGAQVRPIAPVPPAATPPAPVRDQPRSGRGRGPWPWVAGLAGVVVVLGLLVWSPWSTDTEPEALGATTGTIDPDGVGGESLDGIDEPVAAAAARLLPSVVQIDHPGGVGSGFVYSEDGRILTAAHVVAGAAEVTVRTSDGTELVGRVLGGDPVADVAVVEVDATLTAAPLALGRTPQVGQMAVAIGSPLGFEQSVTSGIVSGVDRRLTVAGTTLDGLIQTDAPINQGNSGGPLADRSGEVIGVNVAIATASGGSDGLGFAVGIDKAVEIAERFTGDSPPSDSLDPGAGPDPTEGFGDQLPGLDDPGGMLPPELRGMLEELLDGGLGAEELTPELRSLLEGLLDGGLPSPEGGLPPGTDDLLEDFFGSDEGTAPDGVTEPGIGDWLDYFLFEFGSSPFPDEGQTPDLNDLFDLFSQEEG